ncbi:MAG: DUF4249 domain-containing protein [Sphingobacteriia bacterium]|nr:DUF4249 domain-containing protein [Sphingobacteriia bacterium]
MRKYYLLIAFLGMMACKKIVNVDLKNAPQQLVIEGIVNDVAPPTVTLSKSVTFSSDNSFPPVSGAAVTITDNAGNNFTLTESSQKGTYSINTIIGKSGRTYTMNVTVNGTTYTAVCQMPQLVNFDSLRADAITYGNKVLKVVVPVYTDPLGRGNCYQFIEKINSRVIQNVYAWNDNVNDGGTNTRRLIYSDQIDSLNIKTKDTVAVEMRCIDKSVFNYMYALADLNGSQTTPANPVSNINNGALGYFSAHTSRTKRIIMP